MVLEIDTYFNQVEWFENCLISIIFLIRNVDFALESYGQPVDALQ